MRMPLDQIQIHGKGFGFVARFLKKRRLSLANSELLLRRGGLLQSLPV